MMRELIERGDLAGLRALLTKSPQLAAAPFPDGSWPLHAAAEWDQAEIVELLVRSGARLDSRYADSAHTALSWAVTCWSFNAARKLVELGDEGRTRPVTGPSEPYGQHPLLNYRPVAAVPTRR